MNHSNEQLDLLIAAYRSGEENAASELFSIFSHQMAAIAQRIAQKYHSPSLVDVEGVVNSGFRSFFSAVNKPDFDSRGGKVGGLLATIVSRKALLRLRRLARRPATTQGETDVIDFLVSETQNETIDNQIVIDLTELLESVMSELTTKEQALVESLIDPFEERAFEEIAKSNQTTKLTVESLWRTIQKMLREHLNSSEP